MDVCRVATWNVQHAMRTVSGSDPAEVDLHALAAACASLEVELLAVQEIERRAPRTRFADQVAALHRTMGGHVLFAPAIRVGTVGRYGNALLSARPLHDARTIRLARHDRHERRTAILASADLSIGPVSVAATHLSTDRAESLEQLQQVLDALCAMPQPWLLLGDLNRRPHEVDPLLAERGLMRCPSPHTYPAADPVLTIDVVAASGLRHVRSSTPAPGMSDHRPLVVTLAAAGPTGA